MECDISPIKLHSQQTAFQCISQCQSNLASEQQAPTSEQHKQSDSSFFRLPANVIEDIDDSISCTSCNSSQSQSFDSEEDIEEQPAKQPIPILKRLRNKRTPYSTTSSKHIVSVVAFKAGATKPSIIYQKPATSSTKNQLSSLSRSSVQKLQQDFLHSKKPDQSDYHTDNLFCGLFITLNTQLPSSKLEELHQLILSCGGTVGAVELLASEAVFKKKTTLFISDRVYKTPEYMVALCCRVALVRCEWISQCYQLHKLLPYEAFLLPAGTSLFTGKPIYISIGAPVTPLSCLTLYVAGSSAFRASWTPVLAQAGASITYSIHDISHLESSRYILAENITDIADFRGLAIPFVTLEWVIQSIIHTRALSINYDYRFQLQ